MSKILRSGGTLADLIGAIAQVMFLVGVEAPELAEKATEYYVNKGINKLNKKFTSRKGSGITLTNSEIKDIMKVIKSLEDRGILLKGTTRKITSQKGEFLNFLRPLMTAGSPLMTNVLTSLAKSVLLPFTLMAGLSVRDTAIQKKKKKLNQRQQH